MASTCLLSLVIVVSGSAGDRPALRHASRAQLVAQGQGAGWLSALTEAPGWAQHDYANLVVLPLLSGLTFGAADGARAPAARHAPSRVHGSRRFVDGRATVCRQGAATSAESGLNAVTPSLLEPLSDLEMSA